MVEDPLKNDWTDFSVDVIVLCFPSWGKVKYKYV